MRVGIRDRKRLGLASQISEGLRSIAASAFLFQKFQKQSNRFLLPFEHMLLLLATFSDPSPSPGQAGLAKHRLLNLHGIIPRHVPGGI